MTYQLRDYQQTLLQQGIEAWQRDPNKNYIFDACVSAGKSVMLAAFIKGLSDANPGFATLMLVPNKELVGQNYEKLVALLGADMVGICSASAGEFCTDKPVIVGTVGTIIGRIHDMPAFNMTHVDECHLVNNADKGQYRQLIKICKERNPANIVFGWTGTPYRGNGILLTSGKAPLFDEVAGQITLRDLLDKGWLCPLTPVTGEFIRVTSDDMRKTGQDFNLQDIDAAFDDDTTKACVEQMIPAMKDRKSVMVFCSTIAHAERTAAMLRAAGEKVSLVHSKCEDRDGQVDAFTTHKNKWLVNVCMLTTGFDHPAVDGIVFMRNTNSPVLYVQVAGRGMRRYDAEIGNLLPGHDDKIDCLWLDFTDTTARLGPVDMVQGREMSTNNRKKTKPTKTCPSCGNEVPAGARQCICGHLFVFQNHLGTDASEASILSTDVDTVDAMSVTRHVSQAGNLCGKVAFKRNGKTVGTLYVTAHTPFTLRKMQRLYEALGGKGRAPHEIEGFISKARGLNCPAAVRFDKSSRYPELKDVYFPAVKDTAAA